MRSEDEVGLGVDVNEGQEMDFKGSRAKRNKNRRQLNE